MIGVIGVVDFICKLLPSPFELFHNDIAMRLYSTCNDESGKEENVQKVAENNFQLVLSKIISNVKDVNKIGRSMFSGKCKLSGGGVILCDI